MSKRNHKQTLTTTCRDCGALCEVLSRDFYGARPARCPNCGGMLEGYRSDVLQPAGDDRPT